MDIIAKNAKDFLTGDLWIMPTDRENTLELNESGEINLVDGIPILRILATPSLKKTISRLLYTIKDKMVLFKERDKDLNLNIFKYLDKVYFKNINKNYHRAKKAWYRFIGDFFNDIYQWNFKNAINKTITLLKVLKPILVLDLHNINKWNHINGFKKFVDRLNKNGITIVLRCPIESTEYAKRIFENSKINNIAIIKYYARKKGCILSTKVAKYLLKISQGNLNILDIILPRIKREVRNLRELKIPWSKVIPLILPNKYKKIINIAWKLKKFTINDIEKHINLKLPTIYAYLSELADKKILKKRRIGKNIIFKINTDNSDLLDIFKTLPYRSFHASVYGIYYNNLIIDNFRVFG
ncbi:helix-turn-helix domain-containing protein [Methanothermococcus sp. SCGC AD-155-C09]|nr:helix-turn-helix domain-containing protein [Methanothermococcus sp. SCGC AD-155-C09]